MGTNQQGENKQEVSISGASKMIAGRAMGGAAKQLARLRANIWLGGRVGYMPSSATVLPQLRTSLLSVYDRRCHAGNFVYCIRSTVEKL